VQGSLQANPHDGEVKSLLMNEEDGVENSLIMESDSLAASKHQNMLRESLLKLTVKKGRLGFPWGRSQKTLEWERKTMLNRF
jgi:hypothetical protein